MNIKAHLRLVVALLVFCVLVGAGWVQAQPANDNYANRQVIPGLPFADVEPAIGLATVEVTDPPIFCRRFGIDPGGNTVWYSYATGPIDQYVDFTTVNSDYDTIVAFYTGGPGAFKLVSGGCDDNGAGASRARVTGLRLRANTTYSIVVAQATPNATAATLRIFFDVAPVYHVTKTADTADGVCDADCSLREAISASNTNPGAVVVPAGTYALTRAGVEDNNVSGDLDLRAGMSIYGAGATSTVVDAGDLDRVMDIDPGNTSRVSVQLNRLTLTNGNTTGAGGGLRLLNADCFLTLEDASITNNVAGTTGGGLSLDAISLLLRLTLSGNQAGTHGGGAFFGGTETAVELRDSTVNNNVSLRASGGGGGGIFTQARLRMDQVTISGNSANSDGGGVLLTVRSVVMRNVTIADNVADADNNDASSGGGFYQASGSADIANSVIANNRALGGVPSDLNDCSRVPNALVSAYNHVRRPNNCFFEGPGDTNLDDPLLAPLASNGGPTATHAVLPGSLLIDAGNPTGCVDDNGLALVYDQRGPGSPRTIDGNGNTVAVCDKGAYEFDPAGPQPPNAPSNLTAILVRNTVATLQWNDNSNNEAAFRIERAAAMGGPWATVGTAPDNVTAFTDNTLVPLTTYYYRVFAQNAQGSSAPSNIAMIQTTPVELQSFTVE